MSEKHNSETLDESRDQSNDSQVSKIEQNAMPKAERSYVVFIFRAFCLLLILLLGVGCFYIYKILRAQQDLIDTLGSSVSSAQHEVSKLRDQSQALLERVDHAAISPIQYDLIFSEVEHLIVLATHRLELGGDLQSAFLALESANRRLSGLSGGAIAHVRRQLASDIASLRELDQEQVNISELAAHLGDISDSIDGLKFKSAVADHSPLVEDSPLAGDPDPESLRDKLWHELRKLVVIRPRDQQLDIFSQKEQFFQRLRIELGSARLAVLARDPKSMQRSITLILGWLEQHFDLEQQETRDLVTTLENMQAINLAPDLPDINSSLETFRAYVRSF